LTGLQDVFKNRDIAAGLWRRAFQQEASRRRVKTYSKIPRTGARSSHLRQHYHNDEWQTESVELARGVYTSGTEPNTGQPETQREDNRFREEELPAQGSIRDTGQTEREEGECSDRESEPREVNPDSSLNDTSEILASTPQREPRAPGERTANEHDSTMASDQFVTPMSRMTEKVDADTHSTENLKKQQYPRRPGSYDSVKSDTTVVCMSRVDTAPELGMLHRGASVGGPGKYSTWSGRAKTQSLLMTSTLEFGIELEKTLRAEREKALGLREGSLLR
jgi:hypothetical protein